MNTEPEPSLGSRLADGLTWVLKTTIRLIIVVVSLVVLAFAIQFALQQVTRSLGNVSNRVDLLDGDVADLMQSQAEQRRQLADLSATAEAQGRQVTDAQNRLTRQAGSLSDLESGAAEQADQVETARQAIDELRAGLLALQGDVNDNLARIDALGGDVDRLQSDTSDLQAEAERLAVEAARPNEKLDQLQQALAWFRLWELIARARLHLAEDNAGLAAVDLDNALTAVQGLAEMIPDEQQSALAQVEERLGLAQDNLPDDTLAASRDLEAGWETVDRLLLVLVTAGPSGSRPEAGTPVPEATPTATAVGAATPTGAAVATPTATATAVGTATSATTTTPVSGETLTPSPSPTATLRP